jgi:2,3-bisphosphoglycerate-independent phosphoglycerate mutase
MDGAGSKVGLLGEKRLDLIKLAGTTRKPLVLLILDGWGYSLRREGNAIALAATPNYDRICARYPMALLQASGASVGLAEGAPGTSEAGHMTIGAGRVMRTSLNEIDRAIETGEFFQNPVLVKAMQTAKERGTALHLIGLLSNGKIHSSQEHLFALLRMAKTHRLDKVFIHCILDGHDVTAGSADIFVEALEIKLADIGTGVIATLCGRHFAMDKEQNWDKTARAYTMLVHAEGERATDPVTAVRASYLRGIGDEMIEPVVLEDEAGASIGTIKNGDAVIFFNHRGDRMRQLVRAVTFLELEEADDSGKPKLDVFCLTDYDAVLNLSAAFENRDEKNLLAEVFAQNSTRNCRLTESEKELDITHYFNGCAEEKYLFEEHWVVPSSNDAARPEAPVSNITEKLLEKLETGKTDVFVVNLAAADLAAHAGNLPRTVKAIEEIDACLGKILEKIEALGGALLITSDHGNCEQMIDKDNGGIDRSHTANPVPFHLVDKDLQNLRLREGGTLADVAPTILALMDISKPAEMTGSDLRDVKEAAIAA